MSKHYATKLKERVAELETAVADLTRANATRKRTVEEVTAQRNEALIEAKKLKERLVATEEENAAEYSELREVFADCHRRATELEAERDKLKIALKNSQTALSDCTRHRDNLRDLFKHVEEQRDEYSTALNSSQEDVATLERELTQATRRAQENREAWREEAEAHDAKSKQQQTRIGDLQERNALLRDAVDDAKSTMKTWRKLFGVALAAAVVAIIVAATQ